MEPFQDRQSVGLRENEITRRRSAMKMKAMILMLGFHGLILPQERPDPGGNYLGQPQPGNTPQVFARGIVSDGYQQHGVPAFSPDGNEVFWQTNRLDSAGHWQISVMTMRRSGDRWTAPELTPYSGGPVFSPDGGRLYLGSAGQGEDPCFTEKNGSGWGAPSPIPLVSRFPKLKYAFNLSITASGTLYFLGCAEGWGFRNDFGIYRSELRDGAYAEPELLPPSVNAPGGVLNWTPSISPDESTLLFCSRRFIPADDYGDLFVCFRRADGTWTDRIRLEEPIRSAGLERFPALSPDGRYLFFARDTPGFDEDVYWVSAGIIGKLKEKALQPTHAVN
jgi:hypothetical protein